LASLWVIAALLEVGIGVIACVATTDEGVVDVSFGVNGKHKDGDEVSATMALLFFGDGGIVMGSPTVTVVDEGVGGDLRGAEVECEVLALQELG